MKEDGRSKKNNWWGLKATTNYRPPNYRFSGGINPFAHKKEGSCKGNIAMLLKRKIAPSLICGNNVSSIYNKSLVIYLAKVLQAIFNFKARL
jgi:hypothetical protein